MKQIIVLALFFASCLSLSNESFAQEESGVRLRPPPGGFRGPPPERPSDAVMELFHRDREAISETESEAVREELRALYKVSTDEKDREAIRRFFSRHPSSVSKSNGSSFRPDPNSGVSR